MSAPINDGGPAFPNNDAHGCAFPGMTLRDWFAGQVLVGQVSRDDERSYTAPNKLTFEEWQAACLSEDANHCYRMADAMLEAREVQP